MPAPQRDLPVPGACSTTLSTLLHYNHVRSRSCHRHHRHFTPILPAAAQLASLLSPELILQPTRSNTSRPYKPQVRPQAGHPPPTAPHPTQSVRRNAAPPCDLDPTTQLRVLIRRNEPSNHSAPHRSAPLLDQAQDPATPGRQKQKESTQLSECSREQKQTAKNTTSTP